MHDCHNSRCYYKDESSSVLPIKKKKITFPKLQNNFQNAMLLHSEVQVEEFKMPNESDSPQCIMCVLLLKFNLKGVIPL